METDRRSGELDDNGDRDRDRIALIAKQFAETARKLEEGRKRNRRAIQFMEGALCLALIFYVIGYLTIRDIVIEQKAARYRAVYAACLERNNTSGDIIGFLSDLGARPGTIDRAKARFRTEPDCKTYTIALLGAKVPDGAFDLPRALRERTGDAQ